MREERIAFIGGGNMAEALIRGLLHKEILAPQQVAVSEPRQERMQFLSNTYHVKALANNQAAAQQADIVVLSVKPQIISEVLRELSSAVTPDQLIISIAAGIPTAFIASHLGKDQRIIRAMPNTPAQIGMGAIALCAGGNATRVDLDVAQQLFDAVGISVIVQEHHMDAVTGLSGSGPAYVFLLIEALTDGGVEMGLPRETAQALILQTIIGAGRMVLETEVHPSKLKDMVTSPGGTTIAGLHVLEDRGVRGSLIDAVAAATARSRELGRDLKG